MHEAIIATLDDVAEELERRGAHRLAALVDAGTTNHLLEQRIGMMDETGFDDVMKRNEEVAEEIYDERIANMDLSLLYHSI